MKHLRFVLSWCARRGMKPWQWCAHHMKTVLAMTVLCALVVFALYVLVANASCG